MSEKKLQKYLSQEPSASGQRKPNKIPIILTDSKGKYLQPFCQQGAKSDIIWINKSGKTTDFYVRWLESNVQRISKDGDVHMLIWIGTCDPTTKVGKTITLKVNQDEVIDNAKKNLTSIKNKIVDSTNNNTASFLHTPYYSIAKWNEFKGHPDPQSFLEDDIKLKGTIDSINSHIDDLNSELNTYSPKFNADLEKTRKPKQGKTRRSVNFNLYRDGIHPREALAKVWLKNINRLIQQAC
ncbi:MAG: hypothetical protein ABW168_15920 [Sedimenticola sp.]